jgi:hypothetical protein
LRTGLTFLAACLTVSRLLVGDGAGTFSTLARESLAIGGWVAMSRPMQICLYDWWPLRRRDRIFKKLLIIRKYSDRNEDPSPGGAERESDLCKLAYEEPDSCCAAADRQ